MNLDELQDKERRIALLIGSLDRAVARIGDTSADMLPAISQIVDDLNVVRKGAPPFRKRMASGLVRPFPASKIPTFDSGMLLSVVNPGF